MKEKEEFLKYLRTEVNKIEKKISSLLNKKKPESLYEPCSYILSGGGKRLRPYLLINSAKAFGASPKSVYNAALAVEILHNFTLVHDDIMDNANKRRGRATLHVRNDLSTAVLAGDTLFAVAYRMLLKDCNESHKEVVSAFTECIIEICEGQSLDKDFELQKDVSLAQYKKMIQKKTAVLLSTSCFIGGKLGGGKPEELKALSNFGKNLGMAFQIQDDLLDIIGNEKEFGKSVGIDLVEGKKTFLFLKALEKAKGKERKKLLDVIKNKGIKKAEVKAYKQIYTDLGVIADAEAEIKRYTNKALKSLSLLKENEAINMFKELSNYLITRSK